MYIQILDFHFTKVMHANRARAHVKCHYHVRLVRHYRMQILLFLRQFWRDIRHIIKEWYLMELLYMSSLSRRMWGSLAMKALKNSQRISHCIMHTS